MENVKTVTRKALVAAVARVFEPEVKFDYMVVLVGSQGVGKSHIINLLGQNWYSDSINTVQGKEAIKNQEQHTEESSKEGMIREYLEMLLPDNWNEIDSFSRKTFIHGKDSETSLKRSVQRDKVCAMEIWVELFQGDPKLLTPIQSREINDILRKIEGWKPYTQGSGKIRFGKNYRPQRAFVRNGTRYLG